jgi:hypothetical protein
MSEITEDILAPIFQRYLADFEERVLPLDWQARGILTSEGFAFCALAAELGADLIIESGIWRGKSTDVWCKFFADTARVVAVDQRIPPEVSGRLKTTFPDMDLTLRSGDGISLLPQYATGNPGKKIAVFIDGPKGPTAVNLAKKMFELPNVCLVGMHDVHTISRGKSNATRKYLDSWERPGFCTDADWFVRSYCRLDLRDTGWDSDQKVRWVPYELVTPQNNGERRLGSYGPTAGFAIKGIA